MAAAWSGMKFGSAVFGLVAALETDPEVLVGLVSIVGARGKHAFKSGTAAPDRMPAPSQTNSRRLMAWRLSRRLD